MIIFDYNINFAMFDLISQLVSVSYDRDSCIAYGVGQANIKKIQHFESCGQKGRHEKVLITYNLLFLTNYFHIRKEKFSMTTAVMTKEHKM